ncbi:effector-associated domain 2-containing protein [Streptomyces mirabilis]|uniref:effector-associated domain 2-containing protein n=1 Tax=Streptomyces mirabilis TaxID=68239 RepID=UPI00225ACB9B|nr:trypsin-like peptidase domain-containing protein [Streptomyces mirabilis]MCX4423267.1 serine protease [Streptomyces mirabilis]
MTAQDPRRGLDPVRVAEVMVRPPAGRGPGRRGSGYRVGPWWVLTAAHVVRDAGTGATDVRFEADRADEWTVAARVVLASERADVALLELDGSAPHGVHAAVTEPPSYGAVPDVDLVLPCSAMGFPRFKLREDRMRRLDDGSASQYRDSCHATGMTSVLSNRREGTLELAVTPPESDAEPDRSPWEGMSGAAVWHDDAIVGLVSAHHRTDGLGRLAAVRVDRWYEQLTRSELALLHECAGLPASAPELPRIPSAPTAAARPVTLADLRDDLPLRELDGLVGALTALPTVSDRTTLALVLGSINPAVAAMSPRTPALRPDVFGILRTCLRYPGTLDQLLEAIRLMEGDSAGVARMDEEAVELSRRHRRADESR